MEFILLLAAQLVTIEICSGPDRAERKVTCLVDGDTGWENGVKWRLREIDTPERGENAECAEEPRIAAAATARMTALMRTGYTIEWSGETDRAGRQLVTVRLANGRDAGEVLVEEGLAVRWPHRPRVWCDMP